jgi:uncharacterized SAM-binding protein YcdF (DUF218 family)
LWLPAITYPLIHDEGPGKADIAVILGGDMYGHRILKGGELVAAGYVPLALVSGPRGFYGHYESDYAIAFAVEQGYPASSFEAFRSDANSTRDEARLILAELRRRNVKSFLLVTSDYHTARARRLFLGEERADGGGPAMRTVGCPDEYFRRDSWWRSREAQKTVFLEWSKTVGTVFGF